MAALLDHVWPCHLKAQSILVQTLQAPKASCIKRVPCDDMRSQELSLWQPMKTGRPAPAEPTRKSIVAARLHWRFATVMQSIANPRQVGLQTSLVLLLWVLAEAVDDSQGFVECPVDCSLAEWSDWSDCSVSCGPGSSPANMRGFVLSLSRVPEES